jgi:hypothetical protein
MMPSQHDGGDQQRVGACGKADGDLIILFDQRQATGSNRFQIAGMSDRTARYIDDNVIASTFSPTVRKLIPSASIRL